MPLQHGLSIRKMSNGDIGLCSGSTPNLAGDYFPLFRRPSIADMVEVLRQLSNQAHTIQNENQWAESPVGVPERQRDAAADRKYGPDS
jgi:hypothetical protein